MEALLIDSQSTMLIQLVVAMLLGMLLGTERAIAGKTAGMRTYALVSLGSCLFVIIGSVVAKSLIGITDIDPLRVIAGIVTGVGFIGAGLIIFRDSEITGITTAAGLWIAAGVGIAAGYKLYLLGLFATILTVFVFTIVWFVQSKVKYFSSGGGRTKVVDDVPEDDIPELL